MKKIKTFEGACKALKIKPTLPDYSAIPEKHRKALLAHYKLIIITQALNEGWEPNWSDINEYKYFPWFEVKATKAKPSGVGFSYSCYGAWRTLTYCGSRLCFKNRELVMYAIEQFKKLYVEYYLINQ